MFEKEKADIICIYKNIETLKYYTNKLDSKNILDAKKFNKNEYLVSFTSTYERIPYKKEIINIRKNKIIKISLC